VKDKQIQRLIESERYDEALALCDQRLTEDCVADNDILRQRSHIHALIGNYESALADRAEIIRSSESKLQDFFQAGNAALSLKQFGEAEVYFSQLLKRGEEAGEEWFAAAAYFLTAYAQMMLGKTDEATASLLQAEAIEPACELPIPGRSMWSISRLRSEISSASNRN
jgi:tetratricopeptide (TPR) repeat protein